MSGAKLELIFIASLWLGGGCAAAGMDAGGDDDDTTGDDTGPDAAPRPDAFITDDGGVLEDPAMIDDLEDGDGEIPQSGGRIGFWYTFNDGTMTGMQVPAESGDFTGIAGGAGGSAYCANTSGKGFLEWGAGMGFDFNSTGLTKAKYDASAYTGIRFEAKGNVPMRVGVSELAVIPMADGGSCVPSTVEGMMCDDSHGKNIMLTSQWKTYDLPFAMLTQEGWGKKVDFDPATLTGVQFTTGKNLMFDISVDDVRFY
jgi:hypothetical protein